MGQKLSSERFNKIKTVSLQHYIENVEPFNTLDICLLKNLYDIEFIYGYSPDSFVMSGYYIYIHNYVQYKIPIVMKIYMDLNIPDYRLDAESKIYKNIIDPLIVNKISPHFVYSLGNISCPDILNRLQFLNHVDQIDISTYNTLFNDFYPTMIQHHILRLPPNEYENLPIKIIVNERIVDFDEKTSLSLTRFLKYLKYCVDDYVDRERSSRSSPVMTFPRDESYVYDKVITDLLFQITYSVSVMQLNKIVHNDLHSSNILIEQRRHGEKYYFIVKNTDINDKSGDDYNSDDDISNYEINDQWNFELYPVFSIKTSFIPKIFDFDRAVTFDPVIKNEDVDNDGNICKIYGQCQVENYKHDFYLILCNIKRQLSDNDMFTKFINRNVSKQLLERQHELSLQDEVKCQLKNVQGEGGFIPPDYPGEYWSKYPYDALLHDPLFTNLKINKIPADININNVYAITKDIRDHFVDYVKYQL